MQDKEEMQETGSRMRKEEIQDAGYKIQEAQAGEKSCSWKKLQISPEVHPEPPKESR
jgi:hypothetical protein